MTLTASGERHKSESPGKVIKPEGHGQQSPARLSEEVEKTERGGQ